MIVREAQSFSSENTRFWLALKFIPRLAVNKKLALVREYGLIPLFNQPETLSSLQLSDAQQQAFSSPNWQRIEQVMLQCQQGNIELLCYDAPHYPALLKEIYDPPLVLFVQGNTRLLNDVQVAIVGSRNTSLQGREHADAFAQSLVDRDVVVTSGLALGVDAAAHRGALKASGYTIAVVATGLDRVYPARHKQLATEIINADGAIVSEFLPGTAPKAGLFPKRNRIISGLSLGVLVVEATLKSGSLITAKCAVEQNREVFAVPSSPLNPNAKGCHWLIKQGAKLVEHGADIVEELKLINENELNSKRNNNKASILVKSEKQDLCNDTLLASVGYEITPVDIVVSRSKLPTDVVLTRLTMLELRGLVAAVPGGYLKTN